MYTPTHFSQPNQSVLSEFVRSNAFGCLIQCGPGAFPSVNHLPFILIDDGDQLILQTHVARNNPVWQNAEGTQATVVFQGPHAYISPRAYEEKPLTAKVVPTWNYVVAHAHGLISVQQSESWLVDFLERLTQQHEAQFGTSAWSIHDAPADFLATLCKAIVGIEIRVERFEGKWKLSQNRSPSDRAAIAELLKSPRQVPDWQFHNESAIAQLMG